MVWRENWPLTTLWTMQLYCYYFWYPIININFWSILNKRANLIHLIHSINPDIIVGTETWLTADITDNEIIPPELNYTIYHNDRKGGYSGVMIAVLRNLLLSVNPNSRHHVNLHVLKLQSIIVNLFISQHTTDHTFLISIEQLEIPLSWLTSITPNYCVSGWRL